MAVIRATVSKVGAAMHATAGMLGSLRTQQELGAGRLQMEYNAWLSDYNRVMTGLLDTVVAHECGVARIAQRLTAPARGKACTYCGTRPDAVQRRCESCGAPLP
jgi:hypothetical protein